MLALKERVALSSFAKAVSAARVAAAKEAAAVAAEAAKGEGADAGPDIPALVVAAGYKDWDKSLWPTKAMALALLKGTKGERGSPVPWADPKLSPWYEQAWAGVASDTIDTDHLVAAGRDAESMGFSGVTTELVAKATFVKATHEASRVLRPGEWNAALTRILHALAIMGFLGPSGQSVASGYLALMAKLAADKGPSFAMQYDRDLRRHIASELVPVSDVASLLRSLDVHRCDKVKDTLALQKSKKDAKPQGKGGYVAPPGSQPQSSGSRGQRRRGSKGPPRGQSGQGRQQQGDQKKRKADGQGGKPHKKDFRPR